MANGKNAWVVPLVAGVAIGYLASVTIGKVIRPFPIVGGIKPFGFDEGFDEGYDE